MLHTDYYAFKRTLSELINFFMQFYKCTAQINNKLIEVVILVIVTPLYTNLKIFLKKKYSSLILNCIL